MIPEKGQTDSFFIRAAVTSLCSGTRVRWLVGLHFRKGNKVALLFRVLGWHTPSYEQDTLPGRMMYVNARNLITPDEKLNAMENHAIL